MAITFQEQIKKQRNLIFIFLIVVLITVFIIWRGYRVEEGLLEVSVFERFQRIEIDFEILRNPLLDQLQLIEKTLPFEGEIGRENPFIPYVEIK